MSVHPHCAITCINICVHIKKFQTLAAIPLSWYRKIMHPQGSAALTAAVPYPGKTTWISRKGQRNTWKKLHDSWCCTLFALHFVPLFCFVEFSYSWKVFPATAKKKTGVSCHRTTEAEKIVRTFIVVHHFGMLPFAFALLLPLLAVFLLLRLSSRPFPCSRHKSSSNQQGQSKYFKFYTHSVTLTVHNLWRWPPVFSQGTPANDNVPPHKVKLQQQKISSSGDSAIHIFL